MNYLQIDSMPRVHQLVSLGGSKDSIQKYINACNDYLQHFTPSESGYKTLFDWKKSAEESLRVKSSSGCFIATAVYGNIEYFKLDTLRNFRDEILLKNSIGTRFIDKYYKYSPSLSLRISKSKKLRFIVKVILVEPVFVLSSVILKIKKYYK